MMAAGVVTGNRDHRFKIGPAKLVSGWQQHGAHDCDPAAVYQRSQELRHP